MEAIRKEARRKKRRYSWRPVCAAAAAAVVIGLGVVWHLPDVVHQEASEAYAQPRMAAYTEDTEILTLAQERKTDIAVTYELLQELSGYEFETLPEGWLLYRLPNAEGAAQLSKRYDLLLYTPAEYGEENVSYVLFIS